ncbi:MAG: MotA/TolQ/ExbB proton channel family protein [Pseudomonadota bacterium]
MGILQFIKLFFIQGGFFMYAILIASIFGLAIIIERFYKIAIGFKINSGGFMNGIFQHIENKELDKALQLCNQSKAPLPIIIRAGIGKLNRSESDIQTAIDEATLEQLPRISKRTEYLNMIANVATLLGLLGTILGLIQAFQAVAHADATQKATMLAGGISMALNTTAFGLIVAIPCMISHSVLNSMSDRILDEIDEFSLKLINFLKQHQLVK